MALRDIVGNVLKSVGPSLGFKGNDPAFTKIDTDASFGVLHLNPYISYQSTIEQTFSRLVTAVGAAGYEAFAWFDSTLITFPNNFAIMQAGFRITVGAPQQAMLTTGDATPGLEIPIFWSSNLNNLTFVNEMPGVTFPMHYFRNEANVIASPAPDTAFEPIEFRVLIDPAAIGDAGNGIVRIRSAPEGVPIWGAW